MIDPFLTAAGITFMCVGIWYVYCKVIECCLHFFCPKPQETPTDDDSELAVVNG